MTQDAETIHAHAAAHLRQGMSLDTLCLDILAPAARHFGDLWCADTQTFIEVTIAVGKMRQLMRMLDDAADVAPAILGGPQILLAAVPGSQHTFGLHMVEDFFRRAGWNVTGLPGASARELIAAVQRDRFAAIGLSMSRTEDAPMLPPLIAALRKASRNKDVVILVGGRVFTDDPDAARRLGADATATDARDAVAFARQLVTVNYRN